MINIEKANDLIKWAQQWEQTYKEKPSLEECFTWFEWKFKTKELTSKDKNYIKNILDYNPE
tara:strand:+ start:16847 stop:17029 length:183 start_codon:yes stop_codon:yes gene_type:complete